MKTEICVEPSGFNHQIISRGLKVNSLTVDVVVLLSVVYSVFVIFCGIVLLCVTVFLFCILLFIVLVLYCVCL
jgi:hypothetical protein